MIRSLFRKIAVVLTVLSLTLGGTNVAHAQIAVIETGPALVTQNLTLVESIVSAVQNSAQVTKDYVFDTLAYQVANIAIQSMTKSIVNWINSGFQGSPAFVTDLRTNLRGVGDAVADRFFSELSNQTISTTPFQDKVIDAVRLAYYLHTSPESFYTRYPYTLNQVSANDRAFLAGDFKQGGFNAWFATVMNPQNNPYGAQMLANQALEDAVAGATGDRLEELSWNRGFLSWRGECTSKAPEGTPSLSTQDTCLSYEIKTPGSVIMESLNKVQGVPFDRLVSADEFNEIIGALLNQLATQILGGGGGGGVRGLSQPSSGGGGTFFDRTDTTNNTNLSSTFTTTIRDQKQRLVAFQASWEKIRTAARAAEQKCGTETGIKVALERANAALVKAAESISALTALESDIAATSTTGGNQTLAINAIVQRYTELSSSNIFPSPDEITQAQIESQDTGTAEPGSLYSQMVRLSAPGACSSNN